jgi:site-specific recombinase XerD
VTGPRTCEAATSLSIHDAATRYIEERRRDRTAKRGTLETYRYALLNFAKFADVEQLADVDRWLVEAYAADLQSRYAWETMKIRMRALRGFFAWAVRTGLVREDPSRPPAPAQPKSRPQPGVLAWGDLADTLGPAADQFVRLRWARQEISPDTARNYRDSLRLFVAYAGEDLPLTKVTRDHVEGWIGSQWARAPKTICLRLTALRSFWRWALERELVTTNPTLGVKGPRVPEPIPRALTGAQVARALLACQSARETLIVHLMCQEMLRRGEVARLRLRDVDPERRVALIHGKGGHERLVPLSGATWRVVERMHRPPWDPEAPLVPSLSPLGDPLPPKRIGELVSQVLDRAGVDASGHALRHTGASDMVDGGANIRQVQAALGHRRIQTTERYLRRVSLVELREAMGGRSYGGGEAAL